MRAHSRIWVAAVSGLLLLGGLALLGVVLTHQVSAPQARLTSAAQAEREAAAQPGTPTDLPSRPAPSSSGRSASASEPSPGASVAAKPATGLPASRPVAVDIPAIKVTSRLLHLGLDSSGAIQVPQGASYDQAAWFTGSPTPGQVGPAVIEGHIDGVGTTPSVFFKLGALQPGDIAMVTRADGRVVTF